MLWKLCSQTNCNTAHEILLNLKDRLLKLVGCITELNRLLKLMPEADGVNYCIANRWKYWKDSLLKLVRCITELNHLLKLKPEADGVNYWITNGWKYWKDRLLKPMIPITSMTICHTICNMDYWASNYWHASCVKLMSPNHMDSAIM
jgi:hypothetical protein